MREAKGKDSARHAMMTYTVTFAWRSAHGGAEKMTYMKKGFWAAERSVSRPTVIVSTFEQLRRNAALKYNRLVTIYKSRGETSGRIACNLVGAA